MHSEWLERIKAHPLLTSIIVLTLVGLGALWQWLGSNPTSLSLAWTLRELPASTASAVTQCLVPAHDRLFCMAQKSVDECPASQASSGPVHSRACHQLLDAIDNQANTIRPSDSQPLVPLQSVLEPHQGHPPSTLSVAWQGSALPPIWAQRLVQCFALGEKEDRAPPSVEARFSACSSLDAATRALLAGQS